MRAREQRWRQENKEHIAAQDKQRKERRKVEDFFGWHVQFVRRYNPAVTPSDLRRMWDAQDGRCALTGAVLVQGEAQVDHIVPQARGGSHELANLRWVTTVANNAKRDLTDEEFLALCASVSFWIGCRIRDAA